MVWKSHSAGELGERPQALVASPMRRSKLALLILLPAFIGLLAVMTVIVFGNNQWHLPPIGAADWILLVFPWILLTVVAALWLRLPTEFAVFSDGLKVPTPQIPKAPDTSIRDPDVWGLYSWGAVDSCRWSPYLPGLLSIHLKAVTIRAPRSPTARILVGQTPKLPPMTVDLRVPECYRAEVEKAIRACGKWSA
jgi:hypothetical protein